MNSPRARRHSLEDVEQCRPTMVKGHRRRVSVRRRRDNTSLSNVQAGVLAAVGIAVIVVIIIMPIVRHDRFLAERDAWIPSVPWDSSWPPLPVVANGARALRVEVAQAVYASAGRNAELLQYIPCYCGCRSQGHRSNLDCYVRQHSPTGRVTKWDSHGDTCPIRPDITGDLMLWHQNGTVNSPWVSHRLWR